MDDCCMKLGHVPTFGSWNCCEDNDLPFTECFDSSSRAGLLRYAYSEDQDRDLYVAGDLYRNDVVTPAMIAVPRRRARGCHPHMKEGKKKQNWVTDMKEPPSPPSFPSHSPTGPTPKPVDKDLYNISADLYSKPKKKRMLGLFSSCLLPTCDF